MKRISELSPKNISILPAWTLTHVTVTSSPHFPPGLWMYYEANKSEKKCNLCIHSAFSIHSVFFLWNFMSPTSPDALSINSPHSSKGTLKSTPIDWILEPTNTIEDKFRTPSINVQCWSILIKYVLLIPMSINSD